MKRDGVKRSVAAGGGVTVMKNLVSEDSQPDNVRSSAARNREGRVIDQVILGGIFINAGAKRTVHRLSVGIVPQFGSSFRLGIDLIPARRAISPIDTGRRV